MDEFSIRFVLRLSPRALRVAAAGILVLGLAPELATERVSLSTYYPAPSGVYSQMTTTGNTFLARDPGSAVGIGTTSLAAGAKLHVVGTTVLQNDTILEARDGAPPSPGQTRLLIKSEGANVNFYGYDNAEFPVMSVSNSGSRVVNFPGKVGITNANSQPWGTLDVGGEGIIVVRQPSNECSAPNFRFFGGGPNTVCNATPGVEYVTMVQGVLAQYSVPWGTNFGVTTPGSGYMMCCKCPAGGCNIFP